MRIKKYTGKDMQEALAKVRADLGVEAVILNSRKVKRSGIAAWFAKPYFEVLAAVDENYLAVDRGRTRRTPTAPEPLREAGYSARGGTAVAERTLPVRPTPASDDARPAGTVVPLRPGAGPSSGRRADASESAVAARYGAAAYAARDYGPAAEETAARRPEPTVRTPYEPDALEQLKAEVRSLAGRLEQMQEGVLPELTPQAAPDRRTTNEQLEPLHAARAETVHAARAEAVHAASSGAHEAEKTPSGASDRRTVAFRAEVKAAGKPEPLPAGMQAADDPDQAQEAEHGSAQVTDTTALAGYPARFEAMRRRLIDQEIDGSLAERILGKVRSILPADAAEEEIRRQTGRVLTAALGEPETIRLRADGKPTVVAFIGPTGVGKTTTLAKIAADFTLSKGKRVGLVTADTYRIAAVEQLKTYAEILNLPVTVAYSPTDIRAAVETHRDKDLVLIDTAGRSHRNRQQFDELRQLLTAIETDEVYLVLSVNTGRAACQEILEHYTFMKDYRLLFTKLDEAPVPGIIFNARLRTGKPISYVTAGQSVPDDLEIANPKQLAACLAGLQT
mgnify:CR=1 FL=1